MPPAGEPLARFWRHSAPDLEAVPQPPVAAQALVSPTGVLFTLVREAVWADHVGRVCCWFVWRDGGCVGYVSTTLRSRTAIPFLEAAPLPRGRALDPTRSFRIFRAVLTDGRDPRFAPVPSRGRGIMTAAYHQMIRDASRCGWAIASNPAARSPAARALWARVRALPGVHVVRRGRPAREYAFMLAPALGGADAFDGE